MSIQNATQVSHRHEQVAIAMATAWEKILKAFLYRKNPKIIYYPLIKVKRGEKKSKRRTLSLDDCLIEVQKLNLLQAINQAVSKTSGGGLI